MYPVLDWGEEIPEGLPTVAADYVWAMSVSGKPWLAGVGMDLFTIVDRDGSVEPHRDDPFLSVGKPEFLFDLGRFHKEINISIEQMLAMRAYLDTI